MEKKQIKIRGARVNNLKNIDLDIPRGALVAMTGLSGSGKSSLAFETIYAEGQRRYVESLSSYARQFLGQMDKPDVDEISGLSPAISIDQKTTSKNPRSTVGTVTEIYDYLRLLYARVGTPYCPECKEAITKQSIDQMIEQIMQEKEGARVQILSPIVTNRKGEFKKVFDDLRKNGFVRVRINGEMHDLSEEITLSKAKKHTIEAVIDRLKLREEIRSRLTDSLQIALDMAEGFALVDIDGEKTLSFSEHFACLKCGLSMPELSPQLFSFNSPIGACPTCDGLGHQMALDEELLVPNQDLSLKEGAILPWQKGQVSDYYQNMLVAFAKKVKISMTTPYKDLSQKEKELILYGGDKPTITFKYTSLFKDEKEKTCEYEGLIPYYERRYQNSSSDYVREEIEHYMISHPCPTCKGKRLRKEALAVRVGDKGIAELTDLSIKDSHAFFENLNLEERKAFIANQILKEIKARLSFLNNVGLDYLTLSRASGTLSGGESQRIRLATQIGSGLTGVLYILDEPSIGLHQRDNDRLIETLKHLRDLDNTVIVVEHDEDTIRASDYVVDIGPFAGEHGGEVVACGSVKEVMNTERSITGAFLSGREKIEVPSTRRPFDKKRVITLKGAKENNLKNLTLQVPLGIFTCITGVSGSGKSTLINGILKKAIERKLYPQSKAIPGKYKSIEGLEQIDKIISIDQSPIGRTPRSNPATYTGAFDGIRELFSQTNEAKMRGYKPGRFSFNVKGGRCESCKGDGIIKIEMHFLPDVYVPCEVCKGKRYNRETLEVQYKGKTISDVLEMTVDEAVRFFENVPKIYNKIKTIQDVGLGYIRLGQSATTLSGGEAQRIKLATELSKRPTGKTLYILDEPTTGLHSADIKKLLMIIDRLVSSGETIVIIEHNLDVIKCADYIVDLGKEGGSGGGEIIAKGTPEEIAKNKESYTGKYLKPLLKI